MGVLQRWFGSAGHRDGEAAPAPEVDLSDEEWKARLTPAQYQVLRRAGTEPAWSGRYLHVDGDGTFRCAGCGAALFSTSDKFDSGSGWPSFDRALPDGAIVETSDRSHFMVRTEITCARCGGHLGHVFPDGPTDTGLRYCVNSEALQFDGAGEGAGAGDGAGGGDAGGDGVDHVAGDGDDPTKDAAAGA